MGITPQYHTGNTNATFPNCALTFVNFKNKGKLLSLKEKGDIYISP